MNKSFLILIVFICQLLPSCSKQTVVVGGASMEPSYRDGDKVTVDLNAFKHALPKRWDVVLFKDLAKGELQILRVIALPGEQVDVNPKGILLNGTALVPPATIGSVKYETGPSGLERRPAGYPILVPQDSIFLLGDNSVISYDSRFWGPLPLSHVVGRVRRK